MLFVRFSKLPTLLIAGVLGLVCFAESASQAQQLIAEGNLTVRLQEFGEANFGADAPTDMYPLGDGTGRFVTTLLSGDVRLLDASGTLLDDGLYFSGQGFGATSIAVHPDFASNGLIYQITSQPVSSGTPDFGTGNAFQNVIIEWTADDPSSNSPSFTTRDIMRVLQPFGAHNVYDLAFGPDDMLYISSGDGGGGSDPTRGQNLENIYGTFLRIDPVNTSGPGLITSANGQYGIPTSNFGFDGDVTSGTLDEIYAFGFRSPFRFTFDSENGNIYLGDVGLGKKEEIDLVVAGANYGWRRFEGTLLNDANLELAPENPVHTPPSFEYGRDNGLIGGNGESVVGGFVYRGTDLPELQGKYVFGDLGRQGFPSQDGSPTYLFYGDLDTNGDIIDTSVRRIRIDDAGEQLVSLDPDDDIEPGMVAGRSETFLISIGEDINRELYLLVADDPEFLGTALDPEGRILRLAPAAQDADFDDDLDVDGADFLTLQRGYGAVDPLRSDGDANGNGLIDEQDFAIFAAQYGSMPSGVASVPEPASLILLGLGSCCLACRPRRSSSL